MADPLVISAVAFPVSAMSNAFAGIFGGSGGNDYSTMRLLNLQMKMLENISSKIDVIQIGIEFIIANEHEIIDLLKDVPSKTVAELYKKDLEGLFVLIREKIEAYAIERARDEENANKIFQPIFNELLTTIQISRAKIFLLDNYLTLPIASTCLHFEIFCMVLAEQPKTLIEVTLKSYKKWIKNCLDKELTPKHADYKIKQAAILDEAAQVFTYTKCVKNYDFSPGEDPSLDNPAGTHDYHSYKVDCRKFPYNIKANLTDEQLADIQILLAKGTLSFQELPSRLEVGNEALSVDYHWGFSSASDHYHFENGVTSEGKVVGNFVVKENWVTLRMTEKCSALTAPLNPPVNNAATDISAKLNDNGYYLLTYASLLNIADESIQAIDKFLREPQYLTKNAILSFGYELENVSRAYNERAAHWIKFIDEKVELIEDAERQNKVRELRDKMAELQAGTKDILLDYKLLEEEIASNLTEDLLSGILRILGNIGREIEIGVQNIGRESEIFVQNLGKNLEKAGQDIVTNTDTAIQDVGTLVEAAVHFAEHQIESWGKSLEDAEKRVREGKIVDALWHMGTDRIQSADENFAIAVQESSLLNNIATAAASIYGGPGGAAAYAAWFTYKQTNNFDFALKAGIIAGLTSQGLKLANGMPAQEIADLTKRTLVTSAIGAMSIAASGGSEKDIIEGFLKGSALSMAREYYRSVTNLEIEGRAPTEPAVPKLDQDYMKNKFISLYGDDDQPLFKSVFDEATNETKIIRLYQITDLPRSISMVGLETATLGDGLFTGSETSVPMQLIANVPYANDMAYFHDRWCEAVAESGTELNLTETIVTIIPATLVTVAGSDTPLATQIIDELNEQAVN